MRRHSPHVGRRIAGAGEDRALERAAEEDRPAVEGEPRSVGGERTHAEPRRRARRGSVLPSARCGDRRVQDVEIRRELVPELHVGPSSSSRIDLGRAVEGTSTWSVATALPPFRSLTESVSLAVTGLPGRVGQPELDPGRLVATSG